MKPKITFGSSGNSYNINAPAGNTYTSTIPASYVQRVENAATNLLGGRQTVGGTGVSTTYNTVQPATTITTSNYGTGYGITGGQTSGSNIKFGYGSPATGNVYSTTVGNRATGATVVSTRPVQTYTTSYTTGQTGGIHYVQPPPVSYTTTQVVNVPQVQEVRRVQTVAQPVTVSQVQRVQQVPVQSEIVQQYERPYYQRTQTVNRADTRQEAAYYDEPVKKNKCCGPICWGLLALLGLAALVLGLLFGFGVLGGRKGSGDASAGTDTGAVVANGTYPNYTITVQTTVVNTTTNATTSTNGGSTVVPIVPGGGSTQNNQNTTYMFPPANTSTNTTNVIPNTNPDIVTFGNNTTTTGTTTVSPIYVSPIQVQPITTNTTTQPMSVSPIATQPTATTSVDYNTYTTQPSTVAPVTTQPTTINGSQPTYVQPNYVEPIYTQPTDETTVQKEE